LVCRADRAALQRLRRRSCHNHGGRAGAARPYGDGGCGEARLISALARVFALPRSEQARAVEAALWLLAVRLAFGLLTLPRALRLFGIVQRESGAGRVVSSDAADVSRAIARAARHVP